MGLAKCKRWIAIILATVTVAMALFGCAKRASSLDDLKKPLSPDVQKYSEKIVSVLDQYLNLELTIPDVVYQLSELTVRFEGIGVPSLHDRNAATLNNEPIPGGSKFSESDFVVSDELESSISKFSEMTEAERSALRDTVAFAAGIPALKSDYPARKYVFYDTPDGAVNLLGLQDVPFDSLSVFTLEEISDDWYITLCFDTMNDVDFLDIKTYIVNLMNSASSNEVGIADITVFVQSYNYKLLYIRVDLNEEPRVVLCEAVSDAKELQTFTDNDITALINDAFAYLELNYAMPSK